MKILQIGKFYPVLGGVEKVMLDLTLGLSERGIQCDMLCASAEGGSQIVTLNSCARVIATKTVTKAKSTMISPQMVGLLRRIAPTYDIIHIHHPDPMAAYALYKSGYKGHVVLHWHSDILSQRILLKFYLPLQNWLLRRADTVVCTSPTYGKGSHALQKVSDKLRCVPIGVAPIFPDPKRVAEIRERLAGRKLVFSLGRLVPYKGFSNLVKAARHLPDDYLVVIAGNGPDDDSLRQLIAELGLQGRVVMPGRISDDDRNAMMGAASVFVLPSVEKTEAFGVVLIESMSVGLPVVATRIPGSGTAWVNADGVSGLNAPCNKPLELAEAIIRVVDDKTGTFRAGAARRWRDLFTVDRFIDSMTEIYNWLIVK